MRSRLHLYILILLGFGCSEPFIPDTSESDQQLVVEGYITLGDNNLPPYVILTRSFPFLERIDLNAITDRFINDAEVTVLYNGIAYNLPAICGIPAGFEEAVSAILGFFPQGEVCIYTDLLRRIPLVEGGVYDLIVDVDTIQLTAQTTIPRGVPLTATRWDAPPGEDSDTLARLFITFDEPEGLDFYRYQISTNDGPFIAPPASVTNDRLFENRSFEIPVNDVLRPDEDLDPNSFGLFTVGDTIIFRWMQLDEAHFNFWNTRDFNANNSGPFSSYTRVSGNVDGALGIWGGYRTFDYNLIVE